MTLPEQVRGYLDDESLAALWAAVRRRLERNGVRPEGSVTVDLDEVGAYNLSGLVGRPFSAGRRRISLGELDESLRTSGAGASLPIVMAALTGPLRDRRSEQAALGAEWAAIWTALDTALVDVGLADAPWAASWAAWLRAGVCRRAGADVSREAIPQAVAVIAFLSSRQSEVIPLGTLAARFTGNAHGLDAETLTSTLVLRALTTARAQRPATSAAERRMIWLDAGVATDNVSGTVITWALRPPGDDSWSQMMRDRADLGLVTHLTVDELSVAPSFGPGPVFATENPQILQAAANRGLTAPLVCFAGQPSLAGVRLLTRLGASLRYHGDFDWPGVAIAGRIFAAGATPWRFMARDYLEAADGLTVPLPLSGVPQPTPWDTDLQPAMIRRGVAIHEEAVVEILLADLNAHP